MNSICKLQNACWLHFIAISIYEIMSFDSNLNKHFIKFKFFMENFYRSIFCQSCPVCTKSKQSLLLNFIFLSSSRTLSVWAEIKANSKKHSNNLSMHVQTVLYKTNRFFVYFCAFYEQKEALKLFTKFYQSKDKKFKKGKNCNTTSFAKEQTILQSFDEKNLVLSVTVAVKVSAIETFNSEHFILVSFHCFGENTSRLLINMKFILFSSF